MSPCEEATHRLLLPHGSCCGAGETVIDPDVVRQLLARQRTRSPLDRLTLREREVLGKMAEGHSNTAIGRALSISDAAVAKHIGLPELSVHRLPHDLLARWALIVTGVARRLLLPAVSSGANAHAHNTESTWFPTTGGTRCWTRAPAWWSGSRMSYGRLPHRDR